MRTPYARLLYGGRDLIAGWGPLVLEMQITDERGEEADKLSVRLDDRDGQVMYPPTGALVVAEIGYLETGGAVINEFKIDGVELEGWPQVIILSGASVDAKAKAKERKTETHKAAETPTLGDLIGKIAGRNGWSPAVAQGLAAIPITEAEHQTEESDPAFITRVVKRHDGQVSIKQGRLVATLRSGGTTVSGGVIAPVVVQPRVNLLRYRARWADKPAHGKVEARWFDRLKAEPQKVEVPVQGASGAQGGGDAEEVVARLPDPFPTKDEAQRAAEARARELARGEGSASFEIEGDPSVGAEIPVQVRGVRSGVDGLWTPTSVEHAIGSAGYVTRIECETPGSGDSRGADAGEEGA